MKPLTLILPYYDNAGMLREQQAVWRCYRPEVAANLHVIVVDDCSPNAPAADVVECPARVASFRLYRAGVDIRWNWLFCRNLGAREATTEWLLFTDIDHVVPEGTLRALMTRGYDSVRAYRFARKSMPDLTDYHPHADSFFMAKSLFWKVGGYDERFSGLYGSSSDIRHRLKQIGTVFEQLPEHLVRYPREVISDASTPKHINGKQTRKTPYDDAGLRRVRAEIAALPIHKRKPITLNIPWERLI